MSITLDYTKASALKRKPRASSRGQSFWISVFVAILTACGQSRIQEVGGNEFDYRGLSIRNITGRRGERPVIILDMVGDAEL